ncbi:MAG: VirB4 family type IV secretion system protein [Verrucomicrobiota bacterium]
MLGVLLQPFRHAFAKGESIYYDIEDECSYEDLIDNYLIDRYGCTSIFLELDAPAADVATVNHLVQVQNALTQIVDKMPDYISQVQFMYTTNGSYDEILLEHASYKSPWAVSQALRNLRSQRLLMESKNRKLVCATTIMVITCAPRSEVKAEGSMVMQQLQINKTGAELKPQQRVLAQGEFTESVNTLRLAMNTAIDIAENVGIRTRIMNGKEIAQYFYRLFNPDRSVDMGIPLNYDPDYTPFSNAWMQSTVRVLDDCIKWGDYYHGMVSLWGKPQESQPRIVEAITTGLPFNDVRVTLSLRRLDKQKEIDSLKQKRLVSVGKRRQSVNPLDMIVKSQTPATLAAEENVEASEEIKEQNELIADLRANRIALVQGMLTVHLWHNDRKELKRRKEIVTARIADMNKAIGYSEVESTEPIFIISMPGNVEPMRRWMKMKDRMAADLSPIHKGFTGSDPPVSLFRNASHGLLPLDLFSKADVDAPMTFVSGATGSGKSFLVNGLITQHMIEDPFLIILDVGGSYGPLINQLNGQMVVFDQENPTCFNPLQVFTRGGELVEPDESIRSRILLNLEAMLTQPSDPNGEISQSMRNLLDEAVVQAFAHCISKREPVVRLGHVMERLNNFGREGHVLVDRMKPFLQGGVFGMWFDGPSEFDLKTNVVCFDMKGISKVPVLAKALVPMIVNFVYEKILTERGKRKILLFEEAWQFIANPRIATFLIEAFKTFRKEGAAVLGVSQSLADVARNEIVSSAVIQNVQTWFLMDQGNPDNERLAIQLLDLTEGQADILTSLQRKAMIHTNGELEMYRESLMIRGKGRRANSGRIRVQPMPEEYWLFTTDAQEAVERQRAVDQFDGDLSRALTLLAKKYPGGFYVKKEE